MDEAQAICWAVSVAAGIFVVGVVIGLGVGFVTGMQFGAAL